MMSFGAMSCDAGARDACSNYTDLRNVATCGFLTIDCELDCDDEPVCVDKVSGTGCDDELQTWVDCINDTNDGLTVCSDEEEDVPCEGEKAAVSSCLAAAS